MTIKNLSIVFLVSFFSQSLMADRLIVVFCLYGNDWPHTQHIHSHLYRLGPEGQAKEGVVLNLWAPANSQQVSIQSINSQEKYATKVHGFEFEGDFDKIYKAWKDEWFRKVKANKAHLISNNCADDVNYFLKRVLLREKGPRLGFVIKLRPRIPSMIFKRAVKRLGRKKSRFKDLGSDPTLWSKKY